MEADYDGHLIVACALHMIIEPLFTLLVSERLIGPQTL
jgi:hypothetical protein